MILEISSLGIKLYGNKVERTVGRPWAGVGPAEAHGQGGRVCAERMGSTEQLGPGLSGQPQPQIVVVLSTATVLQLAVTPGCSVAGPALTRTRLGC